MKTVALFFALFCLLLSTVCTAAPNKKSSTKGRQKSTRSNSSENNSRSDGDDREFDGRRRSLHPSQDNRADRKYLAVGEVALVDILHFGVGAEGGYYLNPNTLIEVGYLRATFALFGYSSTHTLLTAEYHKFVGNSFYYFGGGGLSTLSASGIGVGDSLFETYDTSLSHTSFIVQGGIGNRWQMDKLAIGCDWVAYAKPIFKLSSSASFGEEASDEDRAREISEFDTRAMNGILTTVRFHIGVSF